MVFSIFSERDNAGPQGERLADPLHDDHIPGIEICFARTTSSRSASPTASSLKADDLRRCVVAIDAREADDAKHAARRRIRWRDECQRDA